VARLLAGDHVATARCVGVEASVLIVRNSEVMMALKAAFTGYERNSNAAYRIEIQQIADNNLRPPFAESFGPVVLAMHERGSSPDLFDEIVGPGEHPVRVVDGTSARIENHLWLSNGD
jgi:hypothetical protein